LEILLLLAWGIRGMKWSEPEFCMKFYRKIIYILYFSLLPYVYGYFLNTALVFWHW